MGRKHTHTHTHTPRQKLSLRARLRHSREVAFVPAGRILSKVFFVNSINHSSNCTALCILLPKRRFDRIVRVDVPDAGGREAILKVHTRKMKIQDPTVLRTVAEITPGEDSVGGLFTDVVLFWIRVRELKNIHV